WWTPSNTRAQLRRVHAAERVGPPCRRRHHGEPVEVGYPPGFVAARCNSSRCLDRSTANSIWPLVVDRPRSGHRRISERTLGQDRLPAAEFRNLGGLVLTRKCIRRLG